MPSAGGTSEWLLRLEPGAVIGKGPGRPAVDRLGQTVLVGERWRRKPKSEVVVHSDQGSQYTSHDWQAFLATHNLACSMSRLGNCYDNAVAESFSQLLKRERIKRRIYATREEARSDIFDHIEIFYHTRRRHGYNDKLSPVEYQKRHFTRLRSV